MTDVVRFKDFTFSAEPITFQIYPDTFMCLPEIPLDALVELATLTTTDTDRGSVIAKFYDFFDGIMMPESAELFRRRGRKGTRKDPNLHPIGMRHVRDIMPWLMEVYGLRPTQPSDESSTGSSDDATTSTAGA